MIELSQDEKIDLICELIKEYHSMCTNELNLSWVDICWPRNMSPEEYHQLQIISNKAAPYGITMDELETYINTMDCVCNTTPKSGN